MSHAKKTEATPVNTPSFTLLPPPLTGERNQVGADQVQIEVVRGSCAIGGGDEANALDSESPTLYSARLFGTKEDSASSARHALLLLADGLHTVRVHFGVRSSASVWGGSSSTALPSQLMLEYSISLSPACSWGGIESSDESLDVMERAVASGRAWLRSQNDVEGDRHRRAQAKVSDAVDLRLRCLKCLGVSA